MEEDVLLLLYPPPFEEDTCEVVEKPMDIFVEFIEGLYLGPGCSSLAAESEKRCAREKKPSLLSRSKLVIP